MIVSRKSELFIYFCSLLCFMSIISLLSSLEPGGGVVAVFRYCMLEVLGLYHCNYCHSGMANIQVQCFIVPFTNIQSVIHNQDVKIIINLTINKFCND